MSQATQLKAIPLNATKSEICALYDLPKKTVLVVINDAIEKVNDASKVKYTKRINYLNAKHIKEIVKELDPPPGYYFEPLEN